MMDNQDPLFATIWRERQTVKPDPPDYCEDAQDFALWTEGITRDVSLKRDLVSVAQAKVMLTDRYFDWRAYVRKSHRNRVGENGHICIFHVFEEAYRKLKLVELSLSPPMLFLPPPPPPPPTKIVKVYKYDSYPIGELEEDEDDE